MATKLKYCQTCDKHHDVERDRVTCPLCGADLLNARPTVSLVTALRRIAKGTRLSSLDVPLIEDAADFIESLTR